jgi:ring-1,2-phenylacetyl-CoA epoxidase subunit PaaD
MKVIADAVSDTLHGHGIGKLVVINQLSPAWTTDWMTAAGREALKGYGIAPPAQQVVDISGLHAGIRRGAMALPVVACPICASTRTQLVSQFGSTPCKALYKCLDCHEPFDYFKCH